MKRFLSILCWICAAVILMTAVASAESGKTDVWSTYFLKENDKGFPVIGAPPVATYTDRGLEVAAAAGELGYTVQTATAFSLEDGLYLELLVEDPANAGVMVIHFWDQNGILVPNYHCGSGWYGMIATSESGSSYMMHVNVGCISEENPDGLTEVLGNLAFEAPKNEDGALVFSVSLKDGILRVNNKIVSGVEDMLEYLYKIRPDGCVYLGVSMNGTGEESAVSPMVVTRFGVDKDTASIPGTDGLIPETGDPSITSPEFPPAEEPPVDDPSTGGNDETGDDPSSGETGDPAESDDDPDDVFAEPNEPHDGPVGGAVVTPDGSSNEGPNIPGQESFEEFSKLFEGMGSGAGCEASAVVSGASTLMLAAAAVVLRKRRD